MSVVSGLNTFLSSDSMCSCRLSCYFLRISFSLRCLSNLR